MDGGLRFTENILERENGQLTAIVESSSRNWNSIWNSVHVFQLETKTGRGESASVLVDVEQVASKERKVAGGRRQPW